MHTQRRGGAEVARGPDGGAFGRMSVKSSGRGRRKVSLRESGWDGNVCAVADSDVARRVHDSAASRLVGHIGFRGTCCVAWRGSMAAAPTGLGHSVPHAEREGYVPSAGSYPSALPKRGRTMSDRSCAAAIRMPASGWGVAEAGAWSHEQLIAGEVAWWPSFVPLAIAFSIGVRRAISREVFGPLGI
jgi:hypothetical protein